MITIQQERPDSLDARMLIAELEAYLNPLYPPESRHGFSIEQLISENVIFFVIRVDNSAVGCV
ncbi:MAG: N-acetyltransferase, partial [Deinococcota bacterium]